MKRLAPRFALTGVLLAALLPAPPVDAQQVEVASAVDRDTVTVGDVFEVHVQVQVPSGTRARFPNLADTHAAFQPVGSARVHADTARNAAAPTAAVTYRAVYPLTAWQTGVLATPIVPVRLAIADTLERTLRIALPMPHVRSVLPPDTVRVEPRPARGVLVQARAFAWWWLLAAALLLALLAALARWRRARRAEAEREAALPPRERALTALERARSLGLVEARQWKPFFTLVSDAVRGYLGALSPHWAPDRTTTELIAALRDAGVSAEQLGLMQRVLRLADVVKFARHVPTDAEARAAWEAAYAVVEALEAPAPEAVPELEEVA